MKKQDNHISFFDEEDNPVEFAVLEQTTLAGINYLLVEDIQDMDTVLIMKEVEIDDDYVSYEVVEDTEELRMISSIFNELVDDIEVSL